MRTVYVCNVQSDEHGETPLPLPVLNFDEPSQRPNSPNHGTASRWAPNPHPSHGLFGQPLTTPQDGPETPLAAPTLNFNKE